MVGPTVVLWCILTALFFFGAIFSFRAARYWKKKEEESGEYTETMITERWVNSRLAFFLTFLFIVFSICIPEIISDYQEQKRERIQEKENRELAVKQGREAGKTGKPATENPWEGKDYLAAYIWWRQWSIETKKRMSEGESRK